MDTPVVVIFCALAFLVGIVIGFFLAVLVKKTRTYRASGILHIKQTEETDYYTIEITDDLEDIQKRHAIILTIDVSRNKHVL